MCGCIFSAALFFSYFLSYVLPDCYLTYADTPGNASVVQLIVVSSQAVTTAAPAGGVYNAAVAVSLTCVDTGGVGCGSTYYTTDGSTPTASSSIYLGPITISANTTLRYFSTNVDGVYGLVGSQIYIVDTIPPVTTAHPPGGIYSTAQSVTLSCTDDNSGCDETYYTTDGTIPTASSTQYSVTNPIFITSMTVLRFFSTDIAGNSESPQIQTYVISASTSSPPAAPSTSSSGGGFYPGNQTFILENLAVQTASTSIVVTWYTHEPSVSVMSWNVDGILGSSGSVSEISYIEKHVISVNNLQPDEEYDVTLEAVSVGGSVLHDSFFVRTLPVSYPPPNITDFSGTSSFGGNVILTWKNPSIADLDSILITRGTRFFPRDPTEGYIVYQGKGETVLDLNTTPDNEYYYSAFTENSSKIFSSGVGIQFFLGLSTSSIPESGTSLFGGTVSSLPISSINGIIFLNNNIVLTPVITESSSSPFITVGINPDLSLSVIIPASIIPHDTEEIIMKVSDKNSNGGNLFFLFTKMDDGSYQTTVPAYFDYESATSPFILSFLSVGYEVRVHGVFSIGTTNTSPQSATTTHGNDNYFLLYLMIILLLILLIFFMTFKIYSSKKNK